MDSQQPGQSPLIPKDFMDNFKSSYLNNYKDEKPKAAEGNFSVFSRNKDGSVNAVSPYQRGKSNKSDSRGLSSRDKNSSSDARDKSPISPMGKPHNILDSDACNRTKTDDRSQARVAYGNSQRSNTPQVSHPKSSIQPSAEMRTDGPNQTMLGGENSKFIEEEEKTGQLRLTHQFDDSTVIIRKRGTEKGTKFSTPNTSKRLQGDDEMLSSQQVESVMSPKQRGHPQRGGSMQSKPESLNLTKQEESKDSNYLLNKHKTLPKMTGSSGQSRYNNPQLQIDRLQLLNGILDGHDDDATTNPLESSSQLLKMENDHKDHEIVRKSQPGEETKQAKMAKPNLIEYRNSSSQDPLPYEDSQQLGPGFPGFSMGTPQLDSTGPQDLEKSRNASQNVIGFQSYQQQQRETSKFTDESSSQKQPEPRHPSEAQSKLHSYLNMKLFSNQDLKSDAFKAVNQAGRQNPQQMPRSVSADIPHEVSTKKQEGIDFEECYYAKGAYSRRIDHEDSQKGTSFNENHVASHLGDSQMGGPTYQPGLPESVHEEKGASTNRVNDPARGIVHMNYSHMGGGLLSQTPSVAKNEKAYERSLRTEAQEGAEVQSQREPGTSKTKFHFEKFDHATPAQDEEAKDFGSSMTPNNVNQGFVASQQAMSGFRNRKQSVSPTRSVLGLGQINTKQDTSLLQEKYTKAMDELQKVKKEAWLKESEAQKQLAVQNQEIELLREQVAELEQREQKQSQIYSKMFEALDNRDSKENSLNQSAPRIRKPEEMFNSTNMSFGKEIEQIQKQVQDEMQTRINELENILREKEEQLHTTQVQLDQTQLSLTTLQSKFHTENHNLQVQLNNLKRTNANLSSELASKQGDAKNLQAELEQLEEKHAYEIKTMEEDTEKRYEELKNLYLSHIQRAQEHQRQPSSGEDPKENHLSSMEAYMERIASLEKQNQELHKKADGLKANNEAIIKQLGEHKESAQQLDQKVKSKKEKLKSMQGELQAKQQLIDSTKAISEQQLHKIAALEESLRNLQQSQLENQISIRANRELTEIKETKEKEEIKQLKDLRQREEEERENLHKRHTSEISANQVLIEQLKQQLNAQIQLNVDLDTQNKKQSAQICEVESKFSILRDNFAQIDEQYQQTLVRSQGLEQEVTILKEDLGTSDDLCNQLKTQLQSTPSVKALSIERLLAEVQGEESQRKRLAKAIFDSGFFECEEHNCHQEDTCTHCLVNLMLDSKLNESRKIYGGDQSRSAKVLNRDASHTHYYNSRQDLCKSPFTVKQPGKGSISEDGRSSASIQQIRNGQVEQMKLRDILKNLISNHISQKTLEELPQAHPQKPSTEHTCQVNLMAKMGQHQGDNSDNLTENPHSQDDGKVDLMELNQSSPALLNLQKIRPLMATVGLNTDAEMNGIVVDFEDFLLFERLKKMVDAALKLECAGCRKLIPTTQFYDHLLKANDETEITEQDEVKISRQQFLSRSRSFSRSNNRYYSKHQQLLDYINQEEGTQDNLGNSSYMQTRPEKNEPAFGEVLLKNQKRSTSNQSGSRLPPQSRLTKSFAGPIAGGSKKMNKSHSQNVVKHKTYDNRPHTDFRRPRGQGPIHPFVSSRSRSQNSGKGRSLRGMQSEYNSSQNVAARQQMESSLNRFNPLKNRQQLNSNQKTQQLPVENPELEKIKQKYVDALKMINEQNQQLAAQKELLEQAQYVENVQALPETDHQSMQESHRHLQENLAPTEQYESSGAHLMNSRQSNLPIFPQQQVMSPQQYLNEEFVEEEVQQEFNEPMLTMLEQEASNRLKLEVDRMKLQLEQKKTQIALMQEKKAENELELKREKKFLLESFLKTKQENTQLLHSLSAFQNENAYLYSRINGDQIPFSEQAYSRAQSEFQTTKVPKGADEASALSQQQMELLFAQAESQQQSTNLNSSQINTTLNTKVQTKANLQANFRGFGSHGGLGLNHHLLQQQNLATLGNNIGESQDFQEDQAQFAQLRNIDESQIERRAGMDDTTTQEDPSMHFQAMIPQQVTEEQMQYLQPSLDPAMQNNYFHQEYPRQTEGSELQYSTHQPEGSHMGQQFENKENEQFENQSEPRSNYEESPGYPVQYPQQLQQSEPRYPQVMPTAYQQPPEQQKNLQVSVLNQQTKHPSEHGQGVQAFNNFMKKIKRTDSKIKLRIVDSRTSGTRMTNSQAHLQSQSNGDKISKSASQVSGISNQQIKESFRLHREKSQQTFLPHAYQDSNTHKKKKKLKSEASSSANLVTNLNSEGQQMLPMGSSSGLEMSSDIDELEQQLQRQLNSQFGVVGM